MKIFYSQKFLRQYKKLSPEVHARAENKEIIFRNNMFDTRLKTHKLSGIFEGFYAFSVTYSVRIIFKKENDDILFAQIGDHDIYD